MKITKNIGMILLAAWLILNGLMQFVNIAIPAMLMAILAIVAGVLIIFNR